MHIAVVLYDRMTALDAVGPLEVLRFLPDADLELVAETAGPVRTDSPLQVIATTSYDKCPQPDVVVVPGGPGTAAALGSPLVPWLQRVHAATTWTTSVCSGSLLLAHAGLLAGAPAASHFAVLDLLPGLGAARSDERVVVDEEHHVMTAAGVSSGIDMALVLAERLSDRTTAEAIQLVIEYDPQPPRDAGALSKVGADVVRRAVELGRPHGAIPDFWPPPA
ncbi:MAG TPA: DJ-1/PfpI family protein [Nocardioides sp.]|uniref:DJ-1/PfpI family protein n=1 Tax=uncultured Nocardioides sp. TaxID=198441 RepID=UPI000EBD0092|nr:DJ-1/PfpI family protein [uncultured Nocardioides sp.]HCB06970.1 glutamine amidotransferase [Nocardioides sp.]HRD60856.1 DJ-1/PfpI family protein [Nocardioides sp.]HRI95332.1 DJ-1/PfpI family protein [Nocardioides sp.]HRK46290.1 DJ-1/PfpI family protein [Nocardioides sp.]